MPPVLPLLSFHDFCFFSFRAFISAQPCSSSSSSACWIGRTVVVASLEWFCEFSLAHGRNVDVVKVEALLAQLLLSGSWVAVETGLYLEARPMLLRSDGAIEGAYTEAPVWWICGTAGDE